MNLHGKSALVTGGSRGIGRAIALRLAQSGANVAVNYNTHQESALEVVEEIKQLGVNSLALQADISQTDQVKKMANQLLAEWGRSDILVNNAGIRRDSLLPRMSDEVWDEVMAVVKRCYEAMRSDCKRITCSVKIDYREGKKGRLTSKIASVEDKLGKKLKV